MTKAPSQKAAGHPAAGPEPPLAREKVDPHVRAAWRAWLRSLATDAEAATAAAHLYAELPPDARNAWLEALAEDAPLIDVPPVAVYGPLLTVEHDAGRRERIRKNVGGVLGPVSQVRRALLGTAPGRVRVAALVIPLYLDFVRLLVCRLVKDIGFDWVRQDPIVRDADAPRGGSTIEGVQLFATSTEAVIDELAHAVLAHRRSGREVPRLLCDCADLFSAKLGGEAPMPLT